MPELAGGVPAFDVPQYWHRAAGLDDMFIAHTESRHRVRLIWEQVADHARPGHTIKHKIKIRIFLFISLFHKSISKNQDVCKVKIPFILRVDIDLFVYG